MAEMPALLLASLMGAALGFAAHRAGLCTVKAVAEVLTTGRARLLVSFAKSAVWVMGIAALATALSWEGGVRHWPVTPASLAGGLAFGMGAAMNGGCVFSTASRAMDGELGLVMTILGWPIGILLVGARPVAPLGTGDLGLPEPLLLVLGLVLMVELGRIATRIARSGGLGRAVAAPVYTLSAAAAVIGLANAIILIVTGPWSFTRTVLCLGAICDGPGVALAISLAALLGMAASSLQRGAFRIRVPRGRAALRHGAAGVMMGIGMGMIPGGNDGLILYAIPSLSPHALPGYAAILAGILLMLAAMKALGLQVPPVICDGDICRSSPHRGAAGPVPEVRR